MAAPARAPDAVPPRRLSSAGVPVTLRAAACGAPRLRLVRAVAVAARLGPTSPAVYADLDLRRRRAQIAARRLGGSL